MTAFSPRDHERRLLDYLPGFPRLPQHEYFRSQRKRDLRWRQSDYEYSHDYVSPLAMCKDVPFRDEFAIRWMWAIGERMFGVLDNLMQVEADPYLRRKHERNRHFFRGLKKAVTFDIEGVLRTLQEAIEMGGAITRAESVEEFATLFRTIGFPPIHRDYRKDEVFGDMRVAGPNPVMLKKIDRLTDVFLDADIKVMDHHHRGIVGVETNDSLAQAMADGRLFLCDYKILEGLEKSRFPVEKYLYAPVALFVATRDGRLLPVAIQCQQPGAEKNPVFTPGDGYNWRIAMTIVGMADGNVHEPVTHLGHTHLFMEPFALATERQFASRHPLGVLLRPHFAGTLHINHLAQKYLLADKGGVDRLCNGSIDSIRRTTVKEVQDYTFNEHMLPNTFVARKVEDTDSLPNYPYRDDAMLYWEAIREWATDYLAIYYRSDIDVQKDHELRNWCEEILKEGQVADFGENGQISTLSYLADAVTMIIFTSSVQHAAVNFPQYDLMSYALCMPLAIYGEAPTTKNGATENDYLDILPPLELANLQMSLGYGLGSLYYTELADYPLLHFRDPRVVGPLRKFKRRIQDIGAEIHRRNRGRRPYKFLIPEGIPQSINI